MSLLMIVLTGYHRTPIFNVTREEINPSTNQSATCHSTQEHLSTSQDKLETLTTTSAIPVSEPVLEQSTHYQTTNQGGVYSAATTQTISTTTPCPPNMVYGNCSERQGTCQNPLGGTIMCSRSMICVCPDGFLMRGNDCVSQEECECFIDEFGVIPVSFPIVISSKFLWHSSTKN